ncbi:hypothetical protein H9P43_005409 [Blastocladiella emersonii ATCC 22665]|nr:hypothetical protein H9P43_005409 [Blastocladiella emersonii ATCC 22665]
MHLPYELIESTLVLTASLPGQPPHALVAYLSVLPTASATHDTPLYRAVIPRLPWCAPDAASARGNLQALAWWLRASRLKTKPMPLVYSSDAMDSASANGHVAVLNWWRDTSHLDLKYTAWAVRHAVDHGHAAVVAWWCRSGLLAGEIDWDADILQAACRRGHVAVLEWACEERTAAAVADPVALARLAARYGHADLVAWIEARFGLASDTARELHEVAAGAVVDAAMLDEWLRAVVAHRDVAAAAGEEVFVYTA